MNVKELGKAVAGFPWMKPYIGQFCQYVDKRPTSTEFHT